jgi:hypothetical protein
MPNPPPGWRDVLGLMVCHQHKVMADLYLSNADVPEKPSLWRVGLNL